MVDTPKWTWLYLEIYIILPGRSSIEEKAAVCDWKDRNAVSNLQGFRPADRTPTPIEELSRPEEG